MASVSWTKKAMVSRGLERLPAAVLGRPVPGTRAAATARCVTAIAEGFAREDCWGSPALILERGVSDTPHRPHCGNGSNDSSSGNNHHGCVDHGDDHVKHHA